MSRAGDLLTALEAISPRPAGSDAERRAALWAQRELAGDPRRRARVETVWLAPNWVAAQLAHLALAVAGGLVSVTAAGVGTAMIAAAALGTLLDWRLGLSPGRLLTRRRATQHVLSDGPRVHRVHLILTAPLDTARLSPRWPGPLPGWLFTLLGLELWLTLTGVARLTGRHGGPVAVLTLIPTVALVLLAAAAVLVDSPADPGAGVGAVLALTRLLDAAPPANLSVDVVLAGASAGEGRGLRRLLRAQRRERTVTNTVLLGFGAGPGAVYLESDGPLLPLSFFAPLRRLAAETTGLEGTSSRGVSPGLPGRLARRPSLSLLGEPDRLVAAALELVDRIDAYVGELER